MLYTGIINRKTIRHFLCITISLLETVYCYRLLGISELELFPVVFMLLLFISYKLLHREGFRNRLINLCGAFLSLFICFVFYIGKIAWKTESVHFINVENVLTVFCGVPFLYIVFTSCAEMWISEPKRVINMGNKRIEKYIWPISSGMIFACWIPALLANYPGIMISDSTWQYVQAEGVCPLGNHHPIIHTLLIRLAQQISTLVYGVYNPTKAVFVYSLIQMIIMALLFGYIIHKLWIFNVRRYLVVGAILFYALFPMNAIFSIYMTKDVIFSGLVLLFSFLIYHFITADSSERYYRRMVNLIVVSILTMFFRSNGFLVVIGTVAILTFANKKEKIVWFWLSIVLISFGLQKPILSMMNIPETELVESIGVPINQIANVVVNENTLTDQEYYMIDQVMPIQTIKDNYSKYYSDTLKFNSHFNATVIENNKSDYLRLWIKLCLKYPRDAIEAALNLTIGYWYPGVEKGSISYNFSSRLDFYEQIGASDYSESELYKHFITQDVRYSLLEAWLWSPGLAVIVMFVLIFLCIAQKSYKLLISFVPSILGFLSLLIATPSYCETRYIYFVFISLPLWIICLVRERNEENG